MFFMVVSEMCLGDFFPMGLLNIIFGINNDPYIKNVGI